jgi:hypothetical protein
MRAASNKLIDGEEYFQELADIRSSRHTMTDIHVPPCMAMGLTGASTLVRSVIKNFKYPGRTLAGGGPGAAAATQNDNDATSALSDESLRIGTLRKDVGAGLASQLPLRSLAAYFFQGRSIRNGMSSRTGAGTAFIM